MEVTEDSETLGILLSLVYLDKRVCNIPFPQLHYTIRAAGKNAMHGVVFQLGGFMRHRDILENYPLEIFALASQYNLGTDLAKARRTG